MRENDNITGIKSKSKHHNPSYNPMLKRKFILVTFQTIILLSQKFSSLKPKKKEKDLSYLYKTLSHTDNSICSLIERWTQNV